MNFRLENPRSKRSDSEKGFVKFRFAFIFAHEEARKLVHAFEKTVQAKFENQNPKCETNSKF